MHQHHRAPAWSPVLDIGDGVGAVLAHLASMPPSGEIEACPVSEPSARFHTGVHERDLGAGRGLVALFPDVREGSYHLLDPGGEPLTEVVVRSGEVTEVDLRAS